MRLHSLQLTGIGPFKTNQTIDFDELSASGLLPEQFRFIGFLPSKAGQRESALAELVDSTATLVFYEAPHRLREALDDLAAAFGARVVVNVGLVLLARLLLLPLRPKSRPSSTSS